MCTHTQQVNPPAHHFNRLHRHNSQVSPALNIPIPLAPYQLHILRPTNHQPIKFRFPFLCFKGSDVFLVAKEAAMRPLRRLMAQLEAASAKGDEQPHHGRRGGASAVQQPATTVPEVGAGVVRGVRACTGSGWGDYCQELGLCFWTWL